MTLKNKRGMATKDMFVIIIALFLVVTFLGIYGLIFSTIDSNLDIDVDLGQVNLKDVNNNTFGQISDALINRLDMLGIVLIFGTIGFMFLSAFVFRGSYPRVMIVADIFILIGAYILAVYITQSFNTLINADTLLNIYQNSMPLSAGFILKLPGIVAIIGIITMILSYSGIPKEEDDQLLGGVE